MAKKETAHEAVLAAVAIDPLALTDEFTKIPSHLARYNELYADALRLHLSAKVKVDRAYAASYIRCRAEAEETGAKTTEGMIKSMVDNDPTYHAAQDHSVVCEAEKARLWGVLDALRAKRDALISLGAHLRAEMAGSPSIRGEARGARDVASNFENDDTFGVEVTE
jgi:hypothetical protein